MDESSLGTPEQLWPRTELERVEAWRLEVLIRAGCPVAIAEVIATSDADLHATVELLKQGCTPELAAQIVT